MIKRRVTLEDVAVACGLTKMTVSRAIRPNTQVAPATRARVQEAVRRMGYRPDPLLSGLQSHRRGVRQGRRSATIAYVTNYPDNAWRRWPVWSGFYLGAKARADELGYGLEEFAMINSGGAERASKVLHHRGYAGLLLAPSRLPLGFTRLRLEDFPAVAIAHSIRKPRLHYATPDHVHAIQRTMHELKRRGYRRPGLVISSRQDARVERRWSASFRMWQERFLSEENRLALCWAEPADLELAVPRWLEKERPDVVVSDLERMLPLLETLGLVAPREIGYASLSLRPGELGRVAGNCEEAAAVGAAAMDLLRSAIERNERGAPALPCGVHVDGSWHDGLTLRPASRNRSAAS